eukprot:TRINITY_DN17423_c0_g1_i1.p1 TRINITY_DN17423_c0_g1~~TRINITY_DN17423_c0_g1_i1.p1  ORF type:complete len:850 (+),score=102.50 TRINITY_DN17423_c0_g1_i1:58-2607(+)
MVPRRMAMVVVVGCGIAVLVSFSRVYSGLISTDGFDSSPPPGMEEYLHGRHRTFPISVSRMEGHLRKLEQAIADFEGVMIQHDSHLKVPAEPSAPRTALNLSPTARKQPSREPTDPKKNTTGDDSVRLVGKAHGSHGKSVALIIPFRDREAHMVKFREYWRWFAQKGRSPPTVARWEVFTVEQFDSDTFNRGWTFNVGLALASGMDASSPDVQKSDAVSFDCAVIQDIDYLPEEGVDYSDCDVPIQLSSEIDRYGRKVPYVESAGGVVGMNFKHWKKINGFGNNYFGWGGEDDELYHRLRLNKLLYGDCSPFCEGMDQNRRQSVKSIKRPRKGFGRFSGEYMHSMNHTKRITNQSHYAKNLQQLQEIARGGQRWVKDGLSDLAFRIVSHEKNEQDKEAFGITWHHVRARRGKKPLATLKMRLAVPMRLCDHANTESTGYTIKPLSSLGEPMPWTLSRLRALVPAIFGKSLSSCAAAASVNFILVDLRRYLAKVLSDADPQEWVRFLRSMEDPALDGIVIVDERGDPAIVDAFKTAGAFTAPPLDITFCKAQINPTTPKYSMQVGACKGGGWAAIRGGATKAFKSPREGLIPVTWCDNTKHWTQMVLKGETCPKQWKGLALMHGATIWVPPGNSFCTGTGVKSDIPMSNVLPQSNCATTDGFTHSFSFGGVDLEQLVTKYGQALAPLVVSVCRKLETTRISHKRDRCLASSGWNLLATFVAIDVRTQFGRPLPDISSTFCVVASADKSTSDTLEQIDSKLCRDRQAFVFAVHKEQTASASNPRICARKGDGRIGVGEDECIGASLSFVTPSMNTVAASTPTISSGKSNARPLYVFVQESVECASFLCPNT